jgi:ectoine hydroxylase-related dioxygenase (phytanoyl-CoA dioxygenase family)
MVLATDILDPLAGEILESAPPVDFVQLASTVPGFRTKGGVGRNFHIDGGQDRALGVFNVLLGVALTDVESDTAGGFHVLPGSHRKFADLFGQQPTDAAVHWGEVKLEGQRRFLAGAQMVVPHMKAGDIIVAHSFLAHGTAPNTTDKRRDMFFQRRAAAPLWDPATQADAREAFMRDPWMFFRRR